MKTIIKEGKREFIGRCKHCGCEFKYELEDVSFWSVQCPCCDYFICHEDQTNDTGVMKDNVCNPVYPNVPSIGKDVWYSCQTINKVESK